MEFEVRLNIGNLRADSTEELATALVTEELGEYLDYLQWHGGWYASMREA